MVSVSRMARYYRCCSLILLRLLFVCLCISYTSACPGEQPCAAGYLWLDAYEICDPSGSQSWCTVFWYNFQYWGWNCGPCRAPTAEPSTVPSTTPSVVPSTEPSTAPSLVPSTAPSLEPSLTPSLEPSLAPSLTPSMAPSPALSVAPSMTPSLEPSLMPSRAPIPDGTPTACIESQSVTLKNTSPLRIQAENFCDSEGVEIRPTSNEGSGEQNLGSLGPGDWAKYDVVVNKAAAYSASYRVASPAGNGAFDLEATPFFAGTYLLDQVDAFPITNGWQTWQTMRPATWFYLEAGRHTLNMQVQASGWNLNWFEIGRTALNTCGAPENRVWTLTATEPLRIEAEDYCHMFGIVINDSENEEEGAQHVGFLEMADYVQFDIMVEEAAEYLASYRLASNNGEGALQLETDNGANTTTILQQVANFPDTGWWQFWETMDVQTSFPLAAGRQTLTVRVQQSGWNFNWFELVKTGVVVPSEAPSAAPITADGIAKSGPGELCMAWFEKIVDGGRKQRVVARSFDGGDWAAYAGDYNNLVFNCDDTQCTSDQLPDPSGLDILCQTADPNLYTDRDLLARFLEQATFGPRLADLDNWSFNSFGAWVQQQQDETQTPATSHRQVYREHLNTRFMAPYKLGVPTHACAAGTRYRRYAFSAKDRYQELEIRTVSGNKRVLLVNGQKRTVLTGVQTLYADVPPTWMTIPDGFYEICYEVDSFLGGRFRIWIHSDCRPIYTDATDPIDPMPIGILPVYFDAENPPTNPELVLDGYAIPVDSDAYAGGVPQELFVDNELIADQTACQNVPPLTGERPYEVVGTYNGEYWIHDPRYVLLSNTADQPLTDGGESLVQASKHMIPQEHAVWCSNAPMSFLNEDQCYLSSELHVCSSSRGKITGKMELSVDNLKKIYDVSGETRYVYAVTGLRQDESNDPVPYDPPCTYGIRSRWIKVNDCNVEQAGPLTTEIFSHLLRISMDSNPYVRDVFFPSNLVDLFCDNADKARYNFRFADYDGQCWQNVHQDHLQVFDFTDWVLGHPGGADKITQFATDDTFTLLFPSGHDMTRWYEDGFLFRDDMGRLGDKISLSLLPNLAEALDADSTLPLTPSGIVCGSPNEVANIATNYGSLEQGAFDGASFLNQTTPNEELVSQRASIWTHVALTADDQLRQRVAWALSQLLAITPDQIDRKEGTEKFLVYYDIFVRNAFGNYFNVLKEVAHSSVMGQMLTYMDSISTYWNLKFRGKLQYADENFAREVMQLFSIGTTFLNEDGTHVLVDGKPVLTYSNDDITEYARHYTGFTYQLERGNLEDPNDGITNLIDPMQIVDIYRDWFPKLGLAPAHGLRKKYIGDGLPLCVDLPSYAFLRKGATFGLLGASSSPRRLSEPEEWATKPDIKRLLLSPTSELYRKLCNQANPGVGPCRYNSKVVLDSDLGCTGVECDITAPRIIEVEPGIYYEYLRVPCAQHAFYSGAKTLKTRWYKYFCGNPKVPYGTPTCCQLYGEGTGEFVRFTGEQMTWEDAKNICEGNGLELCNSPYWDSDSEAGAAALDRMDPHVGHWTTQGCSMQVKIDYEGQVAVVHVPADEDPTLVMETVREDTKTLFRVDWGETPIDTLLDDYNTQCAQLGCGFDLFDNLCLCDVTVEDTVAFVSAPTRNQVLKELHYGAFAPDAYDMYQETVVLGDGVTMHYNSTDGMFSQDSVFEIVDHNGLTQYRKNLRSTVYVGNSNSFSFRNPTHMMSLTYGELRDAEYETDATIDHYLYHQNTAPFLALHFARRFGISNPSPAYVREIATAFRTGSYTDVDSGTTFGSGKYGDLGALVAAVLLNKEARLPILDYDPAHGSLLEPFPKVIRLLRSLNFVPDSDKRFLQFSETTSLLDALGEQPHEFPNVFSFFHADYSPPGPVLDAGLVSPESLVFTTPKAIALTNGLLSTIKYGFDNAYGGFGRGRGGEDTDRVFGQTDWATGKITYQPAPGKTAAEIVDELATLLTSGRLSQEKRQKLIDVYDGAATPEEALINVEQLIMLTPEFHTSGLSQNTGETVTAPDPPSPSPERYKAVVYVMLEGGMDGYNLLAPNVCQGMNAAGVTIDQQYKDERGPVGLGDDERTVTIDVDAQWNQPCSQFALHDELTFIKQLFDDGELTFYANTGVLDDSTMTKRDYRQKTNVQLFSHNAMREETKTVDPMGDNVGTGVLGRIAQVLEGKGYQTNSLSIDSLSVTITSEKGAPTPDPVVVSRDGATPFDPKPEANLNTENLAFELNKQKPVDGSSSIYGETFSNTFTRAIHQAKTITTQLESVQLGGHWPTDIFEITYLEKKFQTIAKLIKTHDARGTDRDVFYTEYTEDSGWDHHSNMKPRLRTNFRVLNRSLQNFVQELKDMGKWNDVVIVVTSDFGRTTTPNTGQGTDHAWGNHYFMLGGSVDGRSIRGEYPSDITPAGPLNVGRGRIKPTTSWDAIWNGIAEWMGVTTDTELDICLPNRQRSTGNGMTPLFRATDLFTDAARDGGVLWPWPKQNLRTEKGDNHRVRV